MRTPAILPSFGVKPRRLARLAALAGAAVLAVAASDAARAQPPAASAEQPAPIQAAMRVVVSIPPLLGLVKPMLPDGSEARSLLPPGVSEHGFEITPGSADALAKADLVVLVGLGLEPQIEKMLEANPRPGRFVIRFADAVDIKGGAGHGDNHDHDHDHDHDHEHQHGVDPHVWLDPDLVGKFALEFGNELMTVLKQRGGLRFEDLAPLKVEITRLKMTALAIDGMYRDRLEPFRGRAIVTDHDAFSRVAARYGFEVAAVIRPAHGEPTPGAVARIAALIRQKKVSAIFTEPQSNPEVARRLGEQTGVPVLSLDPLGQGDWVTMMKANLDALEKGLKGAGG